MSSIIFGCIKGARVFSNSHAAVGLCWPMDHGPLAVKGLGFRV